MLGVSLSRMLRAVLCAAVLALLPVLASGQTWRGDSGDTGGLVYGSVAAPEYSLVFGCNAPSPQRRPLMETGDHETALNTPFGVFVHVSPQLVPRNAEAALPAAMLVADGTGYRLPSLWFNELDGGWMVELAMVDGLFGALSGAGELVFDTGTGQAWRYPVDGLSEGLSRIMSVCASAWVQAGEALPPGLGGVAAVPVQGLMTPEIDAHLRRECEAPYRIEDRGIAAHDLDRDGQVDRIVDWAGVICDGDLARPYCGAANCSIDVFLSSRPGEPQRLLGVGYVVATAANGAVGLQLGRTAGDCARGLCGQVLWWDGSRFRD